MANKKVSELEESLSISDNDVLYVVDDTTSKKVKFSTVFDSLNVFDKEDTKDLDNLQNDIVFSGYGYTKDLKKSDRFLETDTPNVLVDKGCDSIRFSNGLVERISNKNITFPNAPFSDSSDELLDYSTNGVTTQANHNAGDIVHLGNGGELVGGTNYDGNITPNDETIVFNGITIANISYLVRVFTSGASAGVCSLEGVDISTNGRYSIVTDSTIALTADSDFDGTLEISIKAIEQTYQAIIDTTAGDVVTDETKFKKIDFISRQDVAFIGTDGEYYTFKGYKNFTSGFSVYDIASAYGFISKGGGLFEVSGLECIKNDGTTTAYTGEIACLSLLPRLNAKQYDVVHNPLGSLKDADSKLWYESDNQNTYDILAKGVTYVSGIPDGRFYDKVKSAGNGGLIFRNTLALKPNLSDLLAKKTNEIVGVSEMAEESCCVAKVFPSATSTNQGSYYKDSEKTVVYSPSLECQLKNYPLFSNVYIINNDDIARYYVVGFDNSGTYRAVLGLIGGFIPVKNAVTKYTGCIIANPQHAQLTIQGV